MAVELTELALGIDETLQQEMQKNTNRFQFHKINLLLLLAQFESKNGKRTSGITKIKRYYICESPTHSVYTSLSV